MSSKTPIKFILGTHTIGDVTKDPGIAHFDSEEDVQSLLDAFYSRGYRDLDSARDYGPNAKGSSEERLGRAGAASRFIVHTKVHSGPGAHEPPNIGMSIGKSLDALQTSTLETMFLHAPDRQTSFEATAKAMSEAIHQGKFKRFGLSNYSPAEVQKFVEICGQEGFVQPSVYQGHYNAIVRGGEKELFPLLRKHNMSFFAYSPAAGGLFSGNTDPRSARWKDDNMIGNLYSTFYGKPPVQASLATVRNAVEKHGITGHAAMVRWTAFHSVLDGKYGDGVIFGASKIEQVHKTLDALEAGPLPDELAEAITAIYATVEGYEPPFHL